MKSARRRPSWSVFSRTGAAESNTASAKELSELVRGGGTSLLIIGLASDRAKNCLQRHSSPTLAVVGRRMGNIPGYAAVTVTLVLINTHADSGNDFRRTHHGRNALGWVLSDPSSDSFPVVLG
jgi:hypothetical protein